MMRPQGWAAWHAQLACPTFSTPSCSPAMVTMRWLLGACAASPEVTCPAPGAGRQTGTWTQLHACMAQASRRFPSSCRTTPDHGVCVCRIVADGGAIFADDDAAQRLRHQQAHQQARRRRRLARLAGGPGVGRCRLAPGAAAAGLVGARAGGQAGQQHCLAQPLRITLPWPGRAASALGQAARWQ